MQQSTLSTARLHLRPFVPEDCTVLAQIANNRDIADTTISVPYPYTEAFAQSAIQTFLEDWTQDTAVHFAIVEPLNNQLIGYMALKDIDKEHSQAELSFWIDTDQAGKGFATEAGQAIMHYAFSDLSLNRICAYHMTRNPASGRILSKLGMKQEGHLRQRVIKWGQCEDVLLWAALKSDLNV